jgi:hypothetical protein
MPSNHLPRSLRVALAVGLATGVAAAHAALLPLNHAEESLVRPGMSEYQVRQLLGRPLQVAQAAFEHGPTWIYRQSGPAEASAVLFAVDFSGHGKVASTHRVDEPID